MRSENVIPIFDIYNSPQNQEIKIHRVMKNIKSFFAILAIVAVSASVSSCNRGYGCPNNFSISEQAVQAAQTVVSAAAVGMLK